MRLRALAADWAGALALLLLVLPAGADAGAMVKGAPVLTVTDSASADSAASVIQFVVQDNRVRFRIDGQAAAQNGLAISSKLLSLALGASRRGT